MITSPDQLKAKVRNISNGDDQIAKSYIRIFFMERFLERIASSEYRDQFILKGGMLAASILGINVRSTMDIDTTVRALPLTEEDITRIVTEICAIDLGDNITFEVKSISTIMDDFEYPGIRINLIGYLAKIRQPFKIDVSTDDEITPGAIEYDYSLMFEDRTISLCSYNIETLLAEKLQTILARNVANTRMRDFFDVFSIGQNANYSSSLLKEAFKKTCAKRGTVFSADEINKLTTEIENSEDLKAAWDMFTKKNYFVSDLDWDEVISYVTDFIKQIAI